VAVKVMVAVRVAVGVAEAVAVGVKVADCVLVGVSVGVTMPAIMILGFDLELMRVLLVGLNPSVYAADVGVGFARPGRTD